MAQKIPYKKVKEVRDGHIVKSWETTIHPKPPFFLFVPSYEEIPEKVREENKDRAFILGEFVDTDEEAIRKAKKAGYDEEGIRTLKEQSYLKLKKMV